MMVTHSETVIERESDLFCIHHHVFYSYVAYIFYNYHVKLSAE